MAGIVIKNAGLGLGDKKPVKKKKLEVKYRTPSDSPFPVFVMCQPCYVETDIANNIWMKDALSNSDIFSQEIIFITSSPKAAPR